MTHKSFRDDVYLKELDAVVTSVALSPKRAGCLLVTLDRTVFFPTGGGQSWATRGLFAKRWEPANVSWSHASV